MNNYVIGEVRKGKFIVGMRVGHSYSIATWPVIHKESGLAEDEAKRLAREDPNVVFVVLEVVCAYRSTKVTEAAV